MEKPEDYRLSNNLPYSEWKQEWKDYKNYIRIIKMHPEWKDLNDEQIKIEQRKLKLKALENNRMIKYEKEKLMTPEEKAILNKKKGSHYHRLSSEEKLKHNKILSERSKNFWNSMSEEEREEFGKYRWNLKSDEEKKIIIDRFIEGGRKYMERLSPDEIQSQIENMNKARLNKMNTDEKFRLEQISLLRTNCGNYWSSLDDIDKSKIIRKRIISANMNNNFHKKFEKAFKSSFISKEFYLSAEKYINVNELNKIWDYGIYDKSTNELVMVVDLDGAFYHGDNCDYNGMHGEELYDERRYQIINKDIKIHIIYELKFKQSFESMIKILMIDYNKFIDDQYKMCRSMPFPNPRYSDNELINSYNQLLKLNCNDKYHKSFNIRNREGDRLITHFHPSIYQANTKGNISPYDAWYDDELLKKVIENRIIYVNTLNPNKILQGFNISKVATKVSVFSAGRAKMLINKYLNDCNEIFDPFSGFSGRMLGAVSLGKRYIGQDISEIHVRESNDIIKFLINNCIDIDTSIECRNVLESTGTYECLFTCSPYSDKEQWLGVPVDTRSCDDWIDECLSRFKCKKYLFVVDSTTKYRDYIVDEIVNKSHFGSNSELVILIERV